MKFEIERKFELDIGTIDLERRSIDGASLSSDAPINHLFDGESVPVMLVHEPDAVALPRSIPLLWQHDMSQPIGKIDNLQIADGKIRGRFNFSSNSKAQDVWRDIQDGFLSDTSVKAIPEDWDESGDMVRVTRWNLVEGSVVTIGADNTVGLDRSKHREEVKMTDETVTRSSGDTGTGSGEDNVVALQIAREKAIIKGQEEGIKIERTRISDIESLFGKPAYQGDEFQSLKRALIDGGATIDRAQAQLLDMIGSGVEPAAGGDFKQDAAIVRQGHSDGDKFAEAMSRALDVRLGLEKDKAKVAEIRRDEFAGMNMTELAREYLRRNSVSFAGKNREQIVGLAFTRGISHSASDFANVLENVMNKSLLAGWTETEETWQTWCRQGSLPDFKQGSRTNVSAFSDLELVYENGEYKYGTYSDLKETIQLATYGKLFSISRQALANDDLSSLSRIPMSMGRAASRQIGDLAYNILTQNSGLGPTLNQDSTALFNAAGHSNYYTGAGAPSVTTINTMLTAMALQTDPSGNAILNIRPKYLLVPAALRATAEVLMSSTLNPAEGTTTSFQEPNSVRGVAEVVWDGRLDAASTTAWYMLADQNMHDTVEIAFLDGNSTPYTESREGWTVDGVEYKVRIDAAAAALDFRGIQKHAGA